jgi:CHAT domain-containing protein
VDQPASAVPSDISEYVAADWLAKHNAVTILPSVFSLKALRELAKPSMATQAFLGFGNPLLMGPKDSDRSAWARQRCADPPSGSTQVASRGAPANTSTLMRTGIVDVALIRRQWPLPETADELCAVAQSIGATEDAVYLGERATETTIKTLSTNGTLANARVVHFATHGLSAGEVGQVIGSKAEPALVLTPPWTATNQDDGLLTASEVAQLRLDADWVVLSACNTASGSGPNPAAETLSGLAQAFFYAGGRALLVSHWALTSQPAVDLIVTTFNALKVDRDIDRAEALRRAMATLIASGGGNAHPGNWAPFVVVGAGLR